MKISADGLPDHLARHGCGPLWLITGDEPLLIEESLDQLRHTAREQGCDERQVLRAENGFDWNALVAANQTLSLFSTRQLLELQISGRPGKDGQAALLEYLDSPNPDNILLILAPGLDYRDRKAKWYKMVEQAGTVVTAGRVTRDRLPLWLQDRARQFNLTLTGEAAELLSDRSEGNLLAARQELEKLALVAPDREITGEILVSAVTDNARYSPFDLLDSLHKGHRTEAEARLSYLEASGEELLPLQALLLVNIRQTLKALAALNTGSNLNQAMQAAGVFGARQTLFRIALQRLKPARCHAIIERLQNAETAFKGAPGRLPPWHYMHQAVTIWCG